MARRFFIEKDLSDDEVFDVEGEEAKHILVLRHEAGEKIEINDKLCEILEIDKRRVTLKACEQLEKNGVPEVRITLFQALLKVDKFEYVIQKSVELGASEIIPFISKNVVVKVDEKDKKKKFERWNKISLEASKQCGRSDIVKVEEIMNFSDVQEKIAGYDKCIVAYECETAKLKDFINKNKEMKNIAVVIGAEGGFCEDEIKELLKKDNCVSVSLGSRILRAETASLNMLSILMYELE